ncbi:DUF4153 domain-containing protein [Nocardioides panacisoli]|uniref:Signal transduction histidine-protein kinase/phosphatase MprB n=1 Tax=Nocardioides panacisoli TaxID=627624 RepID=A0ABP7ISL6_9ACTN
MTPLAVLRSLKVKLGVLVAVSVVVAALVANAGRVGGVAAWLSIPVTIALALAVTQLLALGMTAPLREMTAAAQRMARGDYDVRVTATSRDEVGELARAFNTMARDLAGVDRQRRELVASVSHELRTPLTAQRALLENLADGIGDAAALSTALEQAERLSDLVDDLLDLARVDAGKAPLTPVDVPLGPLLEEAATHARATGRDVTYDVRVEPADLVVRADPKRLHQLVANVLDNASRHSPAGGTVTVRARRTPEPPGRYTIEVGDQGPGVAPGDRERVFERFGTLGTADGGGTGLGLAIARWVTDLHGGAIRFVDPEPGGTGALVRVELPLRPAVRTSTAPEETMTPPTPAPTPAPTPGPGVQPVAARPLLDDLFGSLWPERDLPGRLPVLLAAVAAGLFAALVLPFRDAGVGSFLVLVVCGAVPFAVARTRRDPFALACAVLAAALSAIVFLRAADWIGTLCVMAAAGLGMCGLTAARGLPGFVASAVSWPLSGLRGLSWLGRTLAQLTGLGQRAALVRTVVWSVLGLIVFGLLFASADALFAEWADAVLPDLSLDTFVLRLFLTVAVGGAVLAASYLALNPPRVDRAEASSRPVQHRFEWLAPVLVVNAVFAGFLIAQAAVIFGGHDYLQRTTGLTYAEYVHQGFGQLTVATGLTLLVVWAAARKAPRATATDRAWLRATLGVLCAQTLVVVASALYRMGVYQDAYGFTRLRLTVDVFEGWLGLLVLALVGAGVALRGVWLPRFALLSGAAALLGLALLNPDAWIARHNIDRFEDTGKVDWSYLQGLSEDAVPAFTSLPQDLRPCALGDRRRSDDDWLEWNLGRSRAVDVLKEADQYDPATCAAAETP